MVNITFQELQYFFNSLKEERSRFFHFFEDRIYFLSNGKYEENIHFSNQFTYLENDMYLKKKCAEFNNLILKSDTEIVLDFLKKDIQWRSSFIVGSVRYFLKSSFSYDLAKPLFSLINLQLQNEIESENILLLNKIKKQ